MLDNLDPGPRIKVRGKLRRGDEPGAILMRTKRKGQTAIEYLLVTVSLLFVFVMMYRSLQWYLSGQFTKGGIIILKMYKEDPW